MSLTAWDLTTIQSSVGRGAVNDGYDVETVKRLLKAVASYPGERTIDPGEVDEVCDERLIRAIITFQERFTKHPDGVVDPDQETIRKLARVALFAGSCLSRPGPVDARALVKVLLPHQGERYVLGAAVPKDNGNWIGPWDCAEFVAWGIFQVTGRYVGCRLGRAPNHVKYMNAYTGYFGVDLPRCATQVDLETAAEVPGSIALRHPGHGKHGHIVVTRGGNQTIEAAGSRLGVRSMRLLRRTWHSFWQLDSLSYANNQCSFV